MGNLEYISVLVTKTISSLSSAGKIVLSLLFVYGGSYQYSEVIPRL
jgi:hypothetical protein